MIKSHITVLNTLEPEMIFVGAICSSVFPETGMWQICTIDRVIPPTQEDEMLMLETGDFRIL